MQHALSNTSAMTSVRDICEKDNANTGPSPNTMNFGYVQKFKPSAVRVLQHVLAKTLFARNLMKKTSKSLWL